MSQAVCYISTATVSSDGSMCDGSMWGACGKTAKAWCCPGMSFDLRAAACTTGVRLVVPVHGTPVRWPQGPLQGPFPGVLADLTAGDRWREKCLSSHICPGNVPNAPITRPHAQHNDAHPPCCCRHIKKRPDFCIFL